MSILVQIFTYTSCSAILFSCPPGSEVINNGNNQKISSVMVSDAKCFNYFQSKFKTNTIEKYAI